MEKDTQLPILKLADNIPATVQFDGVLGKEFHNEKYDSISYLYILYDVTNNNKKMIWFATEKQHQAVLAQKISTQKVYTILKQKSEGDKYSTLKVLELPNANKDTFVTNQSATSELAEAIENYDHATSSNEKVLPEAAAWAIKTAVMSYDIFDRSHVWPKDTSIEQRLHSLAKKFLAMQKKFTDD